MRQLTQQRTLLRSLVWMKQERGQATGY